MSYRTNRKTLLIVISALVLLSLACLSSGGSSNSEADQGDKANTDLEATAAVLQATQNALEAQAQVPPPATATPQVTAADEDGGEIESQLAPETDSLPSDEIDWDSYGSDEMIYGQHFDAEPSNWFTDVVAGGNNWETWVDNGVFHVELNEKQTQIGSMYEGLYVPRDQGIIVETSFDNVGNVRNNNIILMCNINEDGWYEFVMTSSGLWGIYRFDSYDSSWHMLTQGGLPNYNKNITDHVLSAMCDSNGDLAFGYDYTVLKNSYINDKSYKDGYTGLGVASFNLAGVEIEFDWFQLIKP